jgi:hypothetical protein
MHEVGVFSCGRRRPCVHVAAIGISTRRGRVIPIGLEGPASAPGRPASKQPHCFLPAADSRKTS